MKPPAHMLAVISVFVLTCFAAPKTSIAQDVTAQSGPDRARALVETALELQGSADRLSSLTSLRLEGSGSTSSVGQGSNPERPSSNNPLEVSWVVDFKNGRVWRKRQSFQGEHGYFCFNSVYHQDGAFNYECITGIHLPVETEAADRTRPLLLARFPEPRGRLLDAIDHAGSLEYKGAEDRDGRPVDVVSYTDAGGTNWRLEFDREQGLLRRALGGEVSMTLGAYRTTDEYSDYREIEGITIPMRVRSTRPIAGTIGWAITDDVAYSRAEVDEAVDGELFELSADAAPRLEDAEIAVTEVANSVYFLQNVRPNYNQLMVEFDEFLLVVDAPFSGELADATIAKIRELMPNKPIRYIVPTHFHYDHIGGLPTYVESGAKVLTTAGNRDFFEDFIARSLPDEDLEGVVEEVAGRHQVPGTGPLVELIDIGPNPHADELLVVYLPESRSLYVADVFSVDWGQVRPAIPETFAFDDTLANLGLAVEIVLPGHGSPATRADLERSLEAGRDLSPQSSSPESEEAHYYDFWPGIWVEVVDGRADPSATTFTIRAGVHQAAFEEEWRLVYEGAAHHSSGLRAWDQVTNRWMFVWVSDDGLFQVWEGQKVDGDWYIVREFNVDGEPFLSRQAWIPESADRVVRVMERSFDGGLTWQLRSRTLFERKR